MSWVNDKGNHLVDYLMIDEIFTRPLPLVELAERDQYDGRAITALEEALDSAFFNANVKNGVTKYKDPNKCPTEYLARLSVEYGVHGWYEGEADEDRRATIKSAKSIHRQAGTIKGLTAAIESLGLDVLVTPSDRPYTLTLLTGDTLSADVTRKVMERTAMYKSERDYIYIQTETAGTHTHYRALPSMVRTTYFATSQVSE